MIWAWFESRGCFLVCNFDGVGDGTIAVCDVGGIGTVHFGAVVSVDDAYSFGYVDNSCGVSVVGGVGVDVNEVGNHTSYLSFFLHRQKFLENKIYTKIYTVNCQFTQ